MAVLRVEKRLKNSYVLYITYMLTHTAINVKAVQSAIICVHSSHQKCNFLRQSAREKHICSTYKRCLQYRSTCCINYANERNVESYVRSLTPDLVVYEFSHHPVQPAASGQTRFYGVMRVLPPWERARSHRSAIAQPAVCGRARQSSPGAYAPWPPRCALQTTC